jgi:hypothetical protein
VDTTIKVDGSVRDRLATIARERGTTIRDLVSRLAEATPTQEDLDTRAATATAYIRRHLSADLADQDIEEGEWFWRELEAGRTPATLRPPPPPASSHRPA